MPYKSVDVLQQALTHDVFHYARDSKKAAGRALGTFVEIIAFHLLKSWEFERHIAIERRLPEYANPEITHNVEFSLHPSTELDIIKFNDHSLPITSKKILNRLVNFSWDANKSKNNQLLSSRKIVRNSCTLYEDNDKMVVAYLNVAHGPSYLAEIQELILHPFAVLECKRVGVEEGTKKGPQAIEKAKQGAYVARTLSSVQKIRRLNGEVYGVLDLPKGNLKYGPYERLIQQIITSNDSSFLKDFVLTIGVVSNHGNWFTTGDQNKELKVLAQSYDWLLFLTDKGISTFAHQLLINPSRKYQSVRDAFLNSYGGISDGNIFTKVRMELAANETIQHYIASRISRVEGWFNVVSPVGRPIHELKDELTALASKNWSEMLQ